MKLYAVRDRLIDYFLQPFAAPSDKQVLGAIAITINGGTDAIAQAPQHYEVWRLAEIDEKGHITESHEILCNCASLVRASIREEPGARGNLTPPGPGEIPGAPSGARPDPNANPGPVPNPPHGQESAPRGAHQGAGGSHHSDSR